MRVERRIREGTERNAAVLDPDVERSLERVVRRTRRRVLVHRMLTAAVTIPTVMLAVVFGPRVFETRGSNAPPVIHATRPTPTPSPPLFTGTFTRTLDGNLAVVRANGTAGTWTLTADTNGRMRLVAPPSFAQGAAYRLFERSANVVQTDALGHGPCKGLPAGTYSWARAGRVLMFTVLRDQCDARVSVISAGPWTLHS